MIKRILGAVLLVAASAGAQTQPPDQEEYDGPSILTRDKSSVGERGGKLIDFRYYVDLQGIYDTGFAPFVATPNGTVSNVGTQDTAGPGTTVGWGIVGTRLWKRDRLSVEYHGDYNYQANYTSGSNEFLNLHYSHIIKRRLTLDLRENAGSTFQANGYYRFLPLTSTDLIGVPVNDLFDIRTNFLDTRADITWQKTLRLSFSAGSAGYIVRREQYSIPGTNGFNVHGSVAYRIYRQQSLSLNYNHDWFDFQRSYGHATDDSVQLGYSVDFAHHWGFQAGVGGVMVHVLGLQSVPVDPIVAAVLGITSLSVVSDRTYLVPKFDGALIKRFDHSSAALSFTQGISPGNGVYLTSRQSTGVVSYSYLGISKTAISANATYSSLSSFGQDLGAYHNIGAGFGVTYRVSHDMHMIFRYDFRHYTTGTLFPDQNEQRISVGFGYTPGDRPLAIW